MAYYIGIDVGTGSVRIGIFDDKGEMVITKKQDTKTWSYAEVYKEQSSEDIWSKICISIKEAIAESKIEPKDVNGIGIDATCSLVAIDKDGNPVSLSKTGGKERNIILWMDHRAEVETQKINSSKSEVLKYVGGKISVEMEIPKLLWIKNNLRKSFDETKYFFDLPDYLVYKASGKNVRSTCSLTCKWTYLSYEKKWDEEFFKEINLEEILENNAEKIGNVIDDIGSIAGYLSEESAKEMGLVAGTAVGVSMIDAHAGGVGVLGIDLDKNEDLNKRIALISGTSNCHMAVSNEPRFINGVWGPYYSAMLPKMWLTEGGQSAAGLLVDHIIKTHPAYAELLNLSKQFNTSIYEILNEKLYGMVDEGENLEYLTRDFHILPYFHGNRSPRADSTLKGTIYGLTLNSSIENLVLMYLATIQAVAYGTRHIIEELNTSGYNIDEIYMTGGGTKNPLLLQIHANVTACKIILAKESEAVLLGASILGAVASKDVDDIFDGMKKMSSKGEEILPDLTTKSYHDKKYLVFKEMYNSQMKYREIMK